MKFSLYFEDGSVARTVFYQRLREEVLANRRFEPDAARADVLIPAEDTAMETNWPRFGSMGSATIRGSPSKSVVAAYVERVVGLGRRVCVVNSHPFVRVPLTLAPHPHVIVADINLQSGERAVNPRTISLPALPVTVGTPHARPRSILASFRGAASHPSRLALQRLHDGRDIICEIVSRRNHAGRVDATSGRVDTGYTELMADSVFAFVPRGDAHFSYRLLEAMSFGCIPIILSDDLVPPFDRTIDWSALSVTVSEGAIGELPALLAHLSASRVAGMQRQVASVYQAKLASIGHIVESLFDEIELVVAEQLAFEEAALGARTASVGGLRQDGEAWTEGLLATYRARRGPARRGPAEVIQVPLRRLHGWLGRWVR